MNDAKSALLRLLASDITQEQASDLALVVHVHETMLAALRGLFNSGLLREPKRPGDIKAWNAARDAITLATPNS